MRTVTYRFLLGPSTATKGEMIGIGQKSIGVLIVDQSDLPLAIEWSVFFHHDSGFAVIIFIMFVLKYRPGFFCIQTNNVTFLSKSHTDVSDRELRTFENIAANIAAVQRQQCEVNSNYKMSGNLRIRYCGEIGW